MWQSGETRARNGRETGGAKWRLAHADLLDRANTSMVAAGGRGIYLITDQGQEIIDGPGGMWNLQVGYGERRIAEAIGAQALTMAYNSPWHNTSGPAATLAAQIASLAPAGLNRVFFTTGGSTATDTALQFVAYRNNFLGRPKKKLILAREGAYHGSSYLTYSVSGAYEHMDQHAELVVRILSPVRRLPHTFVFAQKERNSKLKKQFVSD